MELVDSSPASTYNTDLTILFIGFQSEPLTLPYVFFQVLTLQFRCMFLDISQCKADFRIMGCIEGRRDYVEGVFDAVVGQCRLWDRMEC